MRVAIGVLLTALFLGIVIRYGWVAEDAYITLRTVDNFVHGDGLRWNVAERVQAYTHPLWTLLLCAIYAVTREDFRTLIFTGAALSLDEAVAVPQMRDLELIAVDDALLSLSRFDPQQGRIVELRGVLRVSRHADQPGPPAHARAARRHRQARHPSG